jgi:hypothetical protein
MRSLLPLALLGLASLPAAPAAACSVVSGYRVPTNFELAERADTILLGVVESGPAALDGLHGEPALVVRPVEILKGGPVPAEIRLDGIIAPPRFAVRSDPGELEQAHPLAYIGACVRYMFVPGATVLFFLDRHDGRLVRTGEPFSRDAEDVPSASSRWARAVRLYVAVAALPQAERRSALLARQTELRARAGDADAQAIADDIGRQLRGPNRPWNAIMEEEIRRTNR